MSSNDPIIGRKLGDYSIQGLLGQGGMARVYRGYDEKLDRYAAVKVIEPNLITNDENDEYRDRFLREARAIARLNHLNIVSIYQFGQDEEVDLYYMAMEFVGGRDLRILIKEYKKQSRLLTQEQVMTVCRDMADALDFSQSKCVIHRDVKPSNIMVTEEGRSILMDFGLALNAQEGTLGNTFGSVHYIAPEQAVSSAQAVPQSDLYSLGVVMYEMLTGRVPFEDASAMSVALKHISDPPPKPSLLNPDISPQIEEVLMKALDKDPQKRYPTGDALVRALQNAFEAPVTGTPKIKKSIPVPTATDDNSAEEKTVRIDVPPSSIPLTQLPPEELVEDSSTSREGFGRKPGSRSSAMDSSKTQAGGSKIGLYAIIGIVLLIAIIGGGLAASGTGSNEEDPEPTTAQVVSRVTDEPTITPTVAPTETSIPTVTFTTMPTDAPTNEPEATVISVTDDGVESASLPPINASEDDPAEVLLRYDGRSIVLYNRTRNPINVGNLEFRRGQTRYSSIEWNSDDLFSLGGSRCFQLYTIRYTALPSTEAPADICQFRQGFRSTVETFWISPESSAEFEVWQGNELLGSCPTIPRESRDERRCVVDLP